jgi:hypothetical protein
MLSREAYRAQLAQQRADRFRQEQRLIEWDELRRLLDERMLEQKYPS